MRKQKPIELKYNTLQEEVTPQGCVFVLSYVYLKDS